MGVLQIENTRSKKKSNFFFVFLEGFAWIFPKIEWGMDFLGNQTGVAKKNNNNMIRLVPTRIEI